MLLQQAVVIFVAEQIRGLAQILVEMFNSDDLVQCFVWSSIRTRAWSL